MRLRAMLVMGFFLVAAAIWLLPLVICPTCVAFQPGAQYSDLLVSHWPNADFLRQALREWGELPLWNPTILSGAPFAADPLAGLWYPPNWLLLVLPLSLGFNLLFWLHLAWAGWGAYQLMRAEGAGVFGAALAGLSFGGLPKLVGHVGLGHVSLVMAVSWTPWVLLAVRRATENQRLRDAALAGASLGLVFLIDPRWALPAALLGLVYGVRSIAHSHREKGTRWGRLGANAALLVVFAVGTAAVLALPLWEFMQLSTRAALSASEQGALALPAGHLFGLALPHVGGYAEWVVYAGAAVLFLAMLALVSTSPGAGFWGAAALLALLLALGDQTPLYGIVNAVVPGFKLLRIPARWLFVSGLAFSMLAGKGLEALLLKGLPEAILRRIRLAIAALGAFFALLLVGVLVISTRNPEAPWQAWAISSGLGVLAAIWAWVLQAKDVRIRVAAAGWLLLVAVDLTLMNASLLETKPLESILARPSTLDSVDLNEGRVFSPSYSVPQHIAADQGLELADGVNPLQLSAYRDFMASASGFQAGAYSVTLPPFPSGDPSEDWSPRIDAAQLGLLNISHLISAFPLAAEGLTLEQELDGVHVYHNPAVRPRAWVESGPASLDAPWIEAEIVERIPNRIIVNATGPGRLVLSEIAYPGWAAELDGERVEIDTAYNLLRAVELPAGDHEVIFFFRGWTLLFGAGVTLLTLLGLLVLRWRR